MIDGHGTAAADGRAHHFDHDDERRRPRVTRQCISRRTAIVRRFVERTDVLFPKVARDLSGPYCAASAPTKKTNRGGAVTIVALFVASLLSCAEIFAWMHRNGERRERAVVHTRLDQTLHVRINVTFPAVETCDRITVDAIDIGGDVSSLDALLTKRAWADNDDRGSQRGCNLSGQLDVNRVGGIFHFHGTDGHDGDVVVDDDKEWREAKKAKEAESAPSLVPDGAIMAFDASHIIHELTFGPTVFYDRRRFGANDDLGANSLSGAERAVPGDRTGLFMYSCQLVPTTYRGNELVRSLLLTGDGDAGDNGSGSSENEEEATLDTIRYFFTEKFEPKASNAPEQVQSIDLGAKPEVMEEDESLRVEDDVLPGVMIQYELFPFSMEVTRNPSPWTHLFIRLMATVGGVVAIADWSLK